MSTLAIPTTFTDAVLVDGDGMEPTIWRGSVAFLMPPGPLYDGLCAFGADIRRVQLRGRTVSLGLDNPAYRSWHEVDRRDFMADRPRMVAGVVVPHTTEFRQFLRARFGGEGRS